MPQETDQLLRENGLLVEAPDESKAKTYSAFCLQSGGVLLEVHEFELLSSRTSKKVSALMDGLELPIILCQHGRICQFKNFSRYWLGKNPVHFASDYQED